MLCYYSLFGTKIPFFKVQAFIQKFFLKFDIHPKNRPMLFLIKMHFVSILGNFNEMKTFGLNKEQQTFVFFRSTFLRNKGGGEVASRSHLYSKNDANDCR